MRPLVLVPLLLAILLPALAPGSAAQSPTAPHLSPANSKLYAHHHDSDTAELDGWMNTLVSDPTGNDIALGPQDPCCPQARVHTFTLAPALAGDVELDPQGNIVFEAFIGAGGSQGVVRVSTELRHGTEVVAAGAAQNHVYQQAGTGPYPKLTWTVAPAITSLKAGTPLTWSISLTGVAVQTVFISVSAERGSTNVALPVLSTTATDAAPGPVLHNLTGPTATIDLGSDEPSNATHVYAWTTPLAAQRLDIKARLAAGNATLVVVDGANATVHNETIGLNATKGLQGAPGNWTITLRLEGFAGDLNVTIGAPPPASSGTTTGSGTASRTGTTTSRSSSSTGNATGDGKKDTPAVPAFALAAALVAGAALARRRRD